MFSNCSNAQQEKHSVKRVKDVSYMPQDDPEDIHRRIDFYLPENQQNSPLLIWIGGGGWSIVNRKNEVNVAKRFAESGIAVAAVGHRLSAATWAIPDQTKGVQHPAHIQDIAQAFSWLIKNAERYNYDPDKIFVSGFSSGAHLSALLSSDPRYLDKYNLGFENIKGIIPVSGGYDIEHYYNVINDDNPQLAKQHVNAVFGETTQQFKDASPTEYLQNLSVPMLMLSEGDTYMYATIYENKIREETDYRNFEVLHVHKMTHQQLWEDLAKPKSVRREIILDFINGYSK